MTEAEILNLIKNDDYMMSAINVANDLNLPDWLIGAGFVRNKIWDYLHGFKRDKVLTSDIDLIYFDPSDLNKETDQKINAELNVKTGFNFEVVNQARKHDGNNHEPYQNSTDALAHWPETATATAVTIKDGELVLAVPYGLHDLTNLIVRPTPFYKNDLAVFNRRIATKHWLKNWPKLRVIID